MWATVKVLLDGFLEGEEDESRQLATLPMPMGGLGLRSAVRRAPVAYWASWSDVLHMISQRHQTWPARWSEIQPRGTTGRCLGELRAAASD